MSFTRRQYLALGQNPQRTRGQQSEMEELERALIAGTNEWVEKLFERLVKVEERIAALENKEPAK